MASTRTSVYEAAEAYWRHVAPSVDGMLGGFASLNDADVAHSKKFLRRLQTQQGVGRRRALDCGAGIGRVSKHVLLPMNDAVDMVDVTAEFIEQSARFLGAELDARVGRKFVCGLQSFEPPAAAYDVVWVQWVSGHLTDDDLVAFFRRCKVPSVPSCEWRVVGTRRLEAALSSESGAVVLKENISSSEEADYDSDDNSFTRSRQLLLDLFKQAGLRLLFEQRQPNFPSGMYQVRAFALR